MSSGIVMCSVCKREVHQTGPKDPVTKRYGWKHCEDKSAMCAGATAKYPDSLSDIKGKYCGMDR